MDSKSISSPEYDIPAEAQGQVTITSLDRIYNWGRSASVWPMMFGLACCAIEMICAAASRYDIARFVMEVMRPTPRQSDLMIVSGTVTKKMIPIIVRLFNQMPEPKYVLAMGACASCASWLPLVGSPPMLRSATRGWTTPSTICAYATPMYANCTRCSALQSAFAPTSSRTALRRL